MKKLNQLLIYAEYGNLSPEDAQWLADELYVMENKANRKHNDLPVLVRRALTSQGYELHKDYSVSNGHYWTEAAHIEANRVYNTLNG